MTAKITPEFLEGIKDLNFKVLQVAIDDNEGFMAKVHIFGEDQDYVVMTPFSDDEEKVSMLSKVGKLAYEKGASQLIFVSDTYLKTYSNEKDLNTAMENWETERPSLYPDSMRTSAILMYILDFKDAGNEKILVYRYKVVDKKVVQLEPMNDLDSEAGDSLIKRVLSESFFKALLGDFLKKKEVLTEDILNSSKGEKIVSDFIESVEKDYPNLLIKKSDKTDSK